MLMGAPLHNVSPTLGIHPSHLIMNKQQLAQLISDRVGISRKSAEDALEAFTEIVTETLLDEGEVTLAGFGEFSARTRKGRVGVNPQNPNNPLTIPPVRVAKFKAGSRLKKSIKTGKAEKAAPVSRNFSLPPTPPPPTPTINPTAL